MVNTGNTIIKWPGGKARELRYVSDLIPAFDRYVEPFFGGGAMFFHLKPNCAILNDISPNLIRFYRLVQAQDRSLEKYLRAYDEGFQSLLSACDRSIPEIRTVYQGIRCGSLSPEAAFSRLSSLSAKLACDAVSGLLLDPVSDMCGFTDQLAVSCLGKMIRTAKIEKGAPFCEEDLNENLITGFAGGYYLYFRDLYNRAALAGEVPDEARNAANFFFIREYCYGSMFRYNSKGGFNIPYGGMTYNRKKLSEKIDRIFSDEIRDLFSGAELFCSDFSDFIAGHSLSERDFMFLDPPYDSDFSEYEGKAFTKEDQKRLAEILKKTDARFIMIIKNTEFIRSLYTDHFPILCFDKTYAYNVRSRNDRNVEHLIITNIRDDNQM